MKSYITGKKILILLLGSYISLAASSFDEHQSWASRMADRLAENRVVQAAGNLISRWAKDAVDADRHATVRALRKEIEEEYSGCEEDHKKIALADAWHECSDLSEFKIVSKPTIPKGVAQNLLVLMQITAQFLPEIRFNDEVEAQADLVEQDVQELSFFRDIRPELSWAGLFLSVISRFRQNTFDVCYQHSDNVQICYALYDNAHVACCLIDNSYNLRMCDDVFLRGYPEQIYTFGNDVNWRRINSSFVTDLLENSENNYIDFSGYPLYQDIASALTIYRPRLLVYKLSKACHGKYPACYIPTSLLSYGHIELNVEQSFSRQGFLDELPKVIAHELGHSQQFTNNPLLVWYLYKFESYLMSGTGFNLEDAKRYNLEAYADIIAALLLEPSVRNNPSNIGKQWFLPHFHNAWYGPEFKDAQGNFMSGKIDRCDFPKSFVTHPEILKCRLPRVLEVYEKLHTVVPELEKKMAKLRENK